MLQLLPTAGGTCLDRITCACENVERVAKHGELAVRPLND
jgi:hypothetical protein